jgi:hypothetical protein
MCFDGPARAARLAEGPPSGRPVVVNGWLLVTLLEAPAGLARLAPGQYGQASESGCPRSLASGRRRATSATLINPFRMK